MDINDLFRMAKEKVKNVPDDRLLLFFAIYAILVQTFAFLVISYYLSNYIIAGKTEQKSNYDEHIY